MTSEVLPGSTRGTSGSTGTTGITGAADRAGATGADSAAGPAGAAAPMVSLRDLRVSFTGGPKPVHAVNGVDLDVGRGEVVALIGESGSGKSVTLRSLLRLHPARRTRIEGSITVAGIDVLALKGSALADFRGKVAAMVFQDPLLALDPVYSLGDQIIEAIRRHEPISAADARARALALFERVRIPSPERRLGAYPHEMSGGMRQRAMIALALACRPKLLLADEPTTALDATVQIQILLLLRELQRDLGLSVIFVTHDIGAAVEVADRIAVMYAGRIVESGTVHDLIRTPRHPYSIALQKSRAHGALAKGARLETIPGAPPDLADLPPGCAFAPRCTIAADGCRSTQPAAQRVAAGHEARCLRIDEAARIAPTRVG
jgi:peptide/nickel transport system ATP-binding protein